MLYASHFTASEDFLTHSLEKTFPPGTTIDCEEIIILDDNILESTEDFILQLSTSDDQVFLDPIITTVTIVDQQDSMYNLLCYMSLFFFLLVN